MSGHDVPAVQLRHVARGAVLGLAGTGFAGVAGFGLAIAVTRGLDADDAGRFFAATSGFALLVAASTFGTEAGLARFMLRLEVESDRAAVRRAVGWALVPTTLLAAAWALALLTWAGSVSSWLGFGPHGTRLLVCVALALPAAVAADVLLATTRGFGRIGPTVVIDRLVRSGLQVALPFALLSFGAELWLVVTGWLGAFLVSAPLAALAAIRVLGRAPRDAADPALRWSAVGRRFWSFTWARGVGSLAQMGIQKADIIVVAVLLTPVDAALYAAATRFVPLGQMAVQALQQVLQPRFTAILVLGDRRTLAEVFRVSTSWSILLAWPLYLVVAAAPASYLSLFGERYDDAVPVVLLMGAALLVAVATGPVDTLLVMAGRSGLSMANALAALTLDLVLCVVLVPRWGITGAAAAWALAVTTRCTLATWQVRAELAIAPGRDLLLAAALTIGCFVPPVVVASATVGPGLGSWATAALVGLAAYVVVLRHYRTQLGLDLLLPSRPEPPRTSPSDVPDITPTKEREPTCGLETPHAR